MNRRSHFRIYYPEGENPALFVGEFGLPILNLSETGASVPDSPLLVRGGRPLEVILVFPDGGEVSTTARFVRSRMGCTAVRFAPLIGLSRIMQEQRRLQQKQWHVYGKAEGTPAR